MKTFKALLAVLLVAASVFTTDGLRANAESSRFEVGVCHNGQCQAIAKSTGNQCKHCVSKPGDLYCWQHVNNH